MKRKIYDATLAHKSRLMADKIATTLITMTGLLVIVAVVGMMFFLVKTVLPLAASEKLNSGRFIGNTSGFFSVLQDDSSPAMLRLVEKDSFNGCALELSMGSDPVPLQVFYVTKNESSPTFTLSETPNKTNIRCVGTADSKFFILEKNNSNSKFEATLAENQLTRQFLTEDENQAISAPQLAELSAKGYLAHPSGLLTRASDTAPIARLAPTLNIRSKLNFGETLPEFLDSKNADQFQIRPYFLDEHRTLISIKEKKPHEPLTFKKLYLINQSENAITGEKIAAQFDLPIHILPDQLRSLKVLEAFFVGDEFWRIMSNGQILRSIFNSETGLIDSTINSVSLFQLPAFDSLKNATLTLGASVVFLDNGKGNCAALDAAWLGRRMKLETGVTPSSTNENLPAASPVSYLWQTSCSTNANEIQISNPKFRMVLKASADELEAFDITTGRQLFNYTWPELKAERATAENIKHWQTNETDSAATPLESDSILNRVSFSDDGKSLFIQKNKILYSFAVHAEHMSASVRSLFSRVHYEGYDSSSFSWQSTSGGDDFQTKYSIVPLIWGTFKATLYSLMFAIPLGIFSAIYSSEILDRSTRNIIKPAIEMMASLPSVVLGYIAAIIFAPWIEKNVVGVLLAGLSTPFVLYLWGNFLSRISANQISARGLYASRRLLMFVFAGFLLSLFLLLRLGTFIEHTAFGGDIRHFLSGGPGSEGVLWGILILPLVLLVLWSIPVNRFKKIYRSLAFVAGPILSVCIGLLVAKTEVRSNILGAYSQRNTLVIAVAMGFAIIPIIYSLAEDAITSVPASLRAASLACGASVWQTTARVVLPTAASGIFSAVMVGLGRGIGETMIAVMATGNSAVMGLNPFEGLRSLSANIAVELPEAPQGGTHYRILFFSALLLFCFTFVLNSLAEFLRAKYRARSKAL